MPRTPTAAVAAVADAPCGATAVGDVGVDELHADAISNGMARGIGLTVSVLHALTSRGGAVPRSVPALTPSAARPIDPAVYHAPHAAARAEGPLT
jgi:hypothetical protein